MNSGEAKLELVLLEGEFEYLDRVDFITKLTNMDLPQEIINRLSQLWNVTKDIGGHVVNIGKIILIKIWEFMQANPNLIVGMALGAAVTALIPFVGSIVAPLTIAVGAFLGHRLDRLEHGEYVIEAGALGIASEAITLARQFFDLLIEIVEALKFYFK